MTKKSRSAALSGFTLIEVIVAMAILAIMSLLMVGLYGSVCAQLKNNNEVNDRMSEQQRFVETKTKKSAGGNDLYDVYVDSSLKAGSSAYDSATDSGSVYMEIKCVKNHRNTSWENSKTFKTKCAMYVIKNVEDGEPDADDDDLNIDYKYFVGDNG
jgi:prepilin-type N-terminal cleavage/methylation domain-containing protein